MHIHLVHEWCTKGKGMKSKITKRSADRLQPGKSITDTEVRNFGARCMPSGKVRYVYRYTNKQTGKRSWGTLGLHGEITAEQARVLAQKMAGAVADNRDPVQELQLIRQKAKNQKLVSEVLDEFVEKYVRAENLRSEKEIRRIYGKYVNPRIGSMPIEEVRRSTIAELIDFTTQNHGPVMADRVRAHLGKAFNWYEVRTDDFRSPIIRGMGRVKHKERARSRILDDAEIKALWLATEQISPNTAALVRLLLLTGQRRSEVGGMRWDEIKESEWHIPAERYKTKKPHVVPLSDLSLDVLSQVPRQGPYIFGRGGIGPFSGFSKLKRTLDREIQSIWATEHETEIEPWTLHDLRRTARSRLAACGVSRDVAERVLGHSIPGMDGVYDHHTYASEKREALDLLANHIAQITGYSD